MHSKNLLTLLTSILVLGVPAVVLAAVSWTAYVSEENGGPWAYCGPSSQAASGFQCSGSYCDNVRLRCETLPFGITVTGYNVSNAFSEEDDGLGTVTSEGWYRYDGDNYHVCNFSGAAGILTGIRCQGSYCNNITLECATPTTSLGQPATLTSCEWTDYYSEEDGALSYPEGANRFVTGVRCHGSYCDDKSFYVCSLGT
ncbi:hypothetical protein [Nannocystis bainbridge]|uniref:Uncharacterized protein n=1 Tax=Nannocystis bainbridge TaxID=2995303 RepID=A0ABT5ECI5_9BACT|nr:hypothetical protein [Nannocystis bainbridge]MDC0723574.1 hypothetical protein [Nannocystis bainbridge]